VRFLPKVSGRGVLAVVAAVAATAGVMTQSSGAPAQTAVQATALQQQLDTLLSDSRAFTRWSLM